MSRSRLRAIQLAKHFVPTSHGGHREHLTMQGITWRDLGPDDQPEAQKRLPKPSQCVEGKWGSTIGIFRCDQSRGRAADLCSILVSFRLIAKKSQNGESAMQDHRSYHPMRKISKAYGLRH